MTDGSEVATKREDDRMILELMLDPRRGGFELREQGRTIVMVAGRSRGGPLLAGPDETLRGDHSFTLPSTRCGPLELTYDPSSNLLRIDGEDVVVKVRLDVAPTVLRVVFEDFK